MRKSPFGNLGHTLTTYMSRRLYCLNLIAVRPNIHEAHVKMCAEGPSAKWDVEGLRMYLGHPSWKQTRAILSWLHAAGYAERAASPANKRVTLYCVTSLSVSVIERLEVQTHRIAMGFTAGYKPCLLHDIRQARVRAEAAGVSVHTAPDYGIPESALTVSFPPFDKEMMDAVMMDLPEESS